MAPCKFFARGRCTFGASCRNSHEAVGDGTPPPTIPNDKKVGKEGEMGGGGGKSICWFFANGECKYGATCRNEHAVAAVEGEKEEAKAGQSLKPEAPDFILGGLSTEKEGGQVLKPEAPSFVPSISTETLDAKPACRFFAKGYCRDGNSCSFQHGDPKTDRNPTVVEGKESEEVVKPACSFFAKGYCREGKGCSFQHGDPEAQEKDTLTLVKMKESEEISFQTALSQLTISGSFPKEINGAVVTFQAGAEVSDVKLLSDFSSIQISGLPTDIRPTFVIQILSELGFPIPLSSVYIKVLGSAGAIAEVRIEDSAFATTVIQKLEAERPKAWEEFSVKTMIGTMASGAAGNRLQLSTVICTWYQASCVAWLSYDSDDEARAAKSILDKAKIRGRTPECNIRPRNWHDLDNFTTTLQAGNLHPQTTRKNLAGLLSRSSVKPHRITLGTPSHDKSDAESVGIVERILRNRGGLENFQSYPAPGTSKLKATATFVDRSKAADAVHEIHNTKIRELGNSKLFLSHVVSVKYTVPTIIFRAIEKEINHLREDIWEVGHVHLKSYQQAETLKPFTSLRLFGETLKHVAEAKAKLESFLAGTVVMNRDSVLWDSSFLKPSFLPYLNQLGSAHKLYIHRDTRKARLLLYGGSGASRTAVQQALLQKTDELLTVAHTIVLTPELLKKAMQGGMKKLKAKLGTAATLNVSLTPKTISIVGSKADFQAARELLLDSELNNTPSTEDCVVCWTEATEPINTSCGHVYCKDCFANQTSSASDGGIPICCFGAEGKCGHPFSIDELKNMLSFSDFEELLDSSFYSYIRTHPKVFQYCPTPDCPQIYRLTEKATTFLCSTCLSPACTACGVVTHDGMSCEEYQDLSSEGIKAFQKWKEEHDVRDCPNCKVGIEKISGCNHMECKQCGSHICWFCMEVYGTSKECYGHMQVAHENFYGH